jgi:hypothetical protein
MMILNTKKASTIDERVFFLAMSRLASNHTSTRVHLQKINIILDALGQCAMIQLTMMGYGNVGNIAH